MYTFLRLRSQQVISDVIQLLEEMALVDNLGYRALATPDSYSYTTSASAPSLRAARESTVNVMDAVRPGTPDGGNVKVVVRVRKFLQRGSSCAGCTPVLKHKLMLYRTGPRREMSCRNGPSQSIDYPSSSKRRRRKIKPQNIRREELHLR